MLKKLLSALVVAVIVLIGVAYMLPRDVHVERAIVVDRPAAVIFPYLNSLRRANEWSPWAEYDPNVQLAYSGPDAGVGAKMTWSGNKKVGHGSQAITASVTDHRVASALQFGGSGPAEAALMLDTVDGGTRVVWTLDMDVGNNPIGRYFGLFMDKMVGPDYERGLAKLKLLAERVPAAEQPQPTSAAATSANAPTS